MIKEIDKFEALFEELSKVTDIKSAEILVHLLHESAYSLIRDYPSIVHVYSSKLSVAEELLQKLYSNKKVYGTPIPPEKETLV